jgi:hypothetical protein
LDAYIPTINNDITKFNEHVMDLIKSLEARGGKTEDLLANLFKAYSTVPDKIFVDYIGKKEDAYDEGEDLNAEQLMHHAATKYEKMVRDKTWNAPTAADAKILALEAKINSLQKKKRSNSNNNNNRNNSNSNSNRNQANQNQRRPKPDWMKKKPKAADMDKVKKVNGKEYWWCPNHKCYCRHKASDCKGVGVNPHSNQKNQQGGNQQQDKAPNNAQIRLASALTSVAEDEEE